MMNHTGLTHLLTSIVLYSTISLIFILPPMESKQEIAEGKRESMGTLMVGKERSVRFIDIKWHSLLIV